MKRIIYTLSIFSITSLFANTVNAQISLTNADPTSTTNFNDWIGILPTGFSNIGTTEALVYRGVDASGTTGGLYSVPSMGLGFQSSSSANFYELSGTYTNNTTVVIEELRVTYDAFTVFNRTSRVPSWTVSVDGIEITELEWTYGDGDITLTWDIAGLAIPVGSDFVVTFSTDRGTGSGSSPKIGLNNIEVTVLDGSGNVLPIEFGGFTAQATSQSNLLLWNTLSEKEVSKIDILRSHDGINFTSIAQLQSNGFASDYSYNDNTATSQLNYYRLMFNKNGQKTYSNTVKIENASLINYEIYPNPATSEIHVKSIVPGNTTINLYDITGRLIMTEKSNSHVNTLDVQNLTEGQYIIEILNENQVKYTDRIIIK